MRRWHEDRGIMLKRWREEIAKHEFPNFPLYSLAPTPSSKKDDICHCYRGMGFLRKKKPYDCGNVRCMVCHLDKYYYPKNRRNKNNKAIEENLRGWGIV